MGHKTACGKLVENNHQIKAPYNGKIIYFCEEDCLNEFKEDPEKFILSDHFLITFDILEDENQ